MQKKYLEAGEIVSTHGVQGEVKILPWADGPEFLLQFDTFYLDGRPYAVRTPVLVQAGGIPVRAVCGSPLLFRFGRFLSRFRFFLLSRRFCCFRFFFRVERFNFCDIEA